jgi:hypothetical protein
MHIISIFNNIPLFSVYLYLIVNILHTIKYIHNQNTPTSIYIKHTYIHKYNHIHIYLISPHHSFYILFIIFIYIYIYIYFASNIYFLLYYTMKLTKSNSNTHS